MDDNGFLDISMKIHRVSEADKASSIFTVTIVSSCLIYIWFFKKKFIDLLRGVEILLTRQFPIIRQFR